MKRTASVVGMFNAGTISDQPRPSSPRPCSQMTVAFGFAAVSISMAGRRSAVTITLANRTAPHSTGRRIADGGWNADGSNVGCTSIQRRLQIPRATHDTSRLFVILVAAALLGNLLTKLRIANQMVELVWNYGVSQIGFLAAVMC